MDITQIVGEDKFLSVAQMTEVINAAREAKGLRHISAQWIRTLCSDQHERKAKGLVYIPAERVNPAVSNSPFVCNRDIFEPLIPALTDLPKHTGRPSRKTLANREGKKRIKGKVWTQKRAVHHVTNSLSKPPEQVKASAAGVVNRMSGYRICDLCKGDGCEHCVNGWVPMSRPKYKVGVMVMQEDLVRLLDTTHPTAVYGVVLDWSADGELMMRPIDAHMNIMGGSIQVAIDKVEFMERGVVDDTR